MEHTDLIDPLYESYIEKYKVSDKGSAISKQTADVILQTVDSISGQRIVVADLGTGFSSAVLRKYKQDKRPDMRVLSVDTSRNWMQRTIWFLTELDLPRSGIMFWEDFSQYMQIVFDLIVFDIGYANQRHEYLNPLLKGIKEETKIIFDDMHKKHLLGNVQAILNKHFSYDWISMKDQTLDWAGRWASMATNFKEKNNAN